MNHVIGIGHEEYTLRNGDGDEEEILDVQLGLSNGLRLNVVNADLDDVAHFHIRNKEEARQIAEAILKLSDKCWP